MNSFLRRIWLPEDWTTILLAVPGLAYTGSRNQGDVYVALSVFVMQAVWFEWLCSCSANRFAAVAYRMECYAEMKGENAFLPRKGRWLSTAAYEVLLGTLKRVEAKAANLLVVLSLTMGISINVIVENCGSTCSSIERSSLYAMIYAHALPATLLLKCFAHLQSWTPVARDPAAVERELICDLIHKERNLEFAYLQGTLILLVGVACAATIVRS